MFEYLTTLDQQILLFANHLHTPLLDSVMMTATGRFVWIPFYFLLSVFVVRRFGWRRSILAFLLIALTITLADQICSTLLRPLFARPRPSNPDSPISQWVILVNDYRGGRYGFPSCHAANSVALAVFLGRIFRNQVVLWLLLLWAAFLCYTRMYLGVHYPGDILFGSAIGSIIALLTSWAFLRLSSRRMLWRKVSLGVASRIVGFAQSLHVF